MIRELERNEVERTKWLELREERVSERMRWGIRAAQWRALELARELFGASASIRLESFPPRGAFHGLVHLRVPFADLEDHGERERSFSALAGRDELLREVPLLYVFDPDPTARPHRTVAPEAPSVPPGGAAADTAPGSPPAGTSPAGPAPAGH